MSAITCNRVAIVCRYPHWLSSFLRTLEDLVFIPASNVLCPTLSQIERWPGYLVSVYHICFLLAIINLVIIVSSLAHKDEHEWGRLVLAALRTPVSCFHVWLLGVGMGIGPPFKGIGT